MSPSSLLVMKALHSLQARLSAFVLLLELGDLRAHLIQLV